MNKQSKGFDVAKLPIKSIAERKLEEALEKMKDQGTLKKKKKKKNDSNTGKSNKA